MDDNNHTSLIAYDEIVQEALRSVIGKVLSLAAPDGSSLPHPHHFYITFKTRAEGVVIPDHLSQRFPDEMTIVLQNQFWELQVEDTHFSVGLSFSQRPTKLTVPYAAITAFIDPAVDFALQFAVISDMQVEAEEDDAEAKKIDSANGENVVNVDFRKR